jgi:AcrR family transcriptional regulator
MPRPPKITNEEILAAAREVFLEQGVGASTITIAEKAGISEASIFKRFTTKKDLLLAAMGISESAKWMKVLSNGTPTVAIKSELTEICEQMLAFYQEFFPRALMMMQKGNLPFMPPPQIRDTQLLSGYLDRAIAQGYLRSCSSIAVAQMITGAITNYVIQEHFLGNMPIPLPFPKPKSMEPSIFIQSLIEVLWVGIAPEP